MSRRRAHDTKLPAPCIIIPLVEGNRAKSSASDAPSNLPFRRGAPLWTVRCAVDGWENVASGGVQPIAREARAAEDLAVAEECRRRETGAAVSDCFAYLWAVRTASAAPRGKLCGALESTHAQMARTSKRVILRSGRAPLVGKWKWKWHLSCDLRRPTMHNPHIRFGQGHRVRPQCRTKSSHYPHK